MHSKRSESKFTLNKRERLKRKKVIDAVFAEGRTSVKHPLRIVWKEVEDDTSLYPARVAFSVSKKKVPKATARNSIKRRMREAYRLNKQMLYDFFEKKGTHCALVFIYLDRDLLPFKDIEKATIHCLKRLINKDGQVD